jgi:hypothetical protein
MPIFISMKILLLLITGLFINIRLNAQDLPINKQTGLISIRDSFMVQPNFDLKTFQDFISKWGSYISIESEAQKVFNYDGIKNQILINGSSGFELAKNKYSGKGEMIYIGRIKVLGQLSGVESSTGTVKYTLNYTIENGNAVYEFTDFEFVNSDNELNKEKFETENVTNKFVFQKNAFANNKKIWLDIKKSYIERFKVLSNNLKEYITANLKLQTLDSERDPINYINYQKIKDDMTYDEVVKILKDDGKELESSKIKEGDKKITQKTIRWGGKSSKTITIIFQNDKVYSKSQNEL